MNESQSPLEGPAHRKPTRAIVAGAIIGGLITTGFLAVVGILLTRESVPPLTQADYDAAFARWQKSGPQSYDCDIEVFGNRPGRIHIEVRGGEVQQMTRDGVEPKQRRTWDYWSVDGQFDTIAEELEMARDPGHAFGASGGASMMLHARFDPELGYPLIYRRNVLGAHQDMAWQVTRFEAVK